MSKEYILYTRGDFFVHGTSPSLSDIEQYKRDREDCSEAEIFDSWDVVSSLVGEVQEKEYSKPWVKISEERFQEMLEVLPPENWRNTGNFEMFRMCEYMIGNYTSHFLRIRDEYFEAIREAGLTIPEAVKQVGTIFKRIQ